MDDYKTRRPTRLIEWYHEHPDLAAFLTAAGLITVLAVLAARIMLA